MGVCLIYSDNGDNSNIFNGTVDNIWLVSLSELNQPHRNGSAEGLWPYNINV